MWDAERINAKTQSGRGAKNAKEKSVSEKM
jgi:hypothetical protein